MISPAHLRTHVITPVLQAMDMWSPAAANLMLGTAMQESRCGEYLAQIGGPALGIFQIEPSTARDLIFRYLTGRPALRRRFEMAFRLLDSRPINWTSVDHDSMWQQLITDLRFNTAVARLRYWIVPEPLPAADDVEGLARYWKQYYNTHLGRGTEEEWINNYQKLMEMIQ